MQVIKEEGSVPIKAWVGQKADPGGEWEHRTYSPDIEDTALTQLKNLARMPFIAKNGVAVMPDVHAGKGSTVGSVIATERAIIPAAVGVDIGCGMNAVRLSLKAHQLPDNLGEIRSAIEKAVPVGDSKHHDEYVIQRNWNMIKGIELKDTYEVIARNSNYKIKSRNENMLGQLGSLGGGNHFIELCIDENDDVWVVLHSGSRGTGNAIGSYYINKAKELCEQWFIKLPDDDLAYLPEGTPLFHEYMHAIEWAQQYAMDNRRVMMENVLFVLATHLPEFVITQESINCHHNYVERENHFGQNMWVTRKGAIQAREGLLGIIPGSMGQRSFIVRGKGNPQSYCSCSHGAGRTMSRAAAKKKFSLTDLIEQTKGVECRKDEDVIDEIPGAYKDIDAVMANQADLVDVVHTIKQVLCVKG